MNSKHKLDLNIKDIDIIRKKYNHVIEKFIKKYHLIFKSEEKLMEFIDYVLNNIDVQDINESILKNHLENKLYSYIRADVHEKDYNKINNYIIDILSSNRFKKYEDIYVISDFIKKIGFSRNLDLIFFLIKKKDISSLFNKYVKGGKINLDEIPCFYKNNLLLSFIDFFADLNNVIVVDENDNIYDNYDYNDSISAYFKDIGKYPVLSKEEENALIFKISNGDLEAKKKFILSNLRLVAFVAKKFYSSSVDFLDMIQEGNIGLIHAVDKFDPTKGFRFSTYAVSIIRDRIYTYVNTYATGFKTPKYYKRDLKKVLDAKENLKIKNEKDPTISEIARELNFSENKIINMLNYGHDIISIDELAFKEDDKTELIDLIIDPNSNTEKEAISNVELKELLDVMSLVLTERNKNILVLLFGLNGKAPLKIDEVSNMYGISHQRVAKIKIDSLEKLKKYFENENFSLLKETSKISMKLDEKILDFKNERNLKKFDINSNIKFKNGEKMGVWFFLNKNKILFLNNSICKEIRSQFISYNKDLNCIRNGRMDIELPTYNNCKLEGKEKSGFENLILYEFLNVSGIEQVISSNNDIIILLVKIYYPDLGVTSIANLLGYDRKYVQKMLGKFDQELISQLIKQIHNKFIFYMDSERFNEFVKCLNGN